MTVLLVFEVSLSSNCNICVTLLIVIAIGKCIILSFCQRFTIPGNSWFRSQRCSLINIRRLGKRNFCIPDGSIVNKKVGSQSTFIKTKSINCITGSSCIHIVFKRNSVVFAFCQGLTVESNCQGRSSCISCVSIGTRRNIAIGTVKVEICVQLCCQGFRRCGLHRCGNGSSSCTFQLNHTIWVYGRNCGITSGPVKGSWIQNGFHIRKSCACYVNLHGFLCFGEAYR